MAGMGWTDGDFNGDGRTDLGCAIAPGLEASAETLRLQAVQIPEVKLEFPPRAIGRSTAESLSP